MPPKRSQDIPEDGLSRSRSRRENVKAPRRPDDEPNQQTQNVPEHVSQRIARDKRNKKKAAAKEIEANPLAFDDALERKDLTQWVSPTYTGDDDLDEQNYIEERTRYLVKFIAHRDGYDVRPELEAGTLHLEELEEMFIDGVDPDGEGITPTGDSGNGKGKGVDPSETPNMKAKAVNAQSKTGTAVPQTRTAYDSILFDQRANMVAAKSTAQEGSKSHRPIPHNLGGLRLMVAGASAQGNQTPLRRTDTSTWVEGMPINQYANPKSTTTQFQSQTPTPLNRPTSSSNAARPMPPNTSVARAVGNTKVPANRSTNTNAVTQASPSNAQSLLTPARTHIATTPASTPQASLHVDNPQPEPVPRASRRPDISQNPGNARKTTLANQSHPTTTQRSAHGTNPSHVRTYERQMPTNVTATITGYGNVHATNHSQIVANARPAQTTPGKTARRATTHQSRNNTSKRPHPYHQTQSKNRPQALGRAQGRQIANVVNDDHAQNQPDDDVHPEEGSEVELEDNLAIDKDSETDPDAPTGLDMLALLDNTKNGNSTAIGSFDAQVRPLVKHMCKLAKPQIIANGIYDDTEAALATVDFGWPEEWAPRRSREVYVAQSWKAACKKHRVPPFPVVHRLITCVDALIVPFCTNVKKLLKPVVDAHYGFHPNKPDQNKTSCDRLLDHGFHDKDPIVQKNPFEHDYLREACKVVAFAGGAKSMGVRYSDAFNNAPPPFIAFICAITHHIILGYRDGHFAETENLNVSVQTAAFRLYLQLLVEMHENQPQALTNIRGRIHDHCWSSVKKAPVPPTKPQPSRKWNRDTDEVYVRKFNVVTEQAEDEDTDDGYGQDGNVVHNGEDHDELEYDNGDPELYMQPGEYNGMAID